MRYNKYSITAGEESAAMDKPMNEYAADAPRVLRDFLTYISTIRGKSAKTAHEYYLDLRLFFRVLKHNKGAVDKNLPLDEIDISDIDLDFIRNITLSDTYDYLEYMAQSRPTQQNSNHTNYGLSVNSRARKVSAIRAFFRYLTDKQHVLEVINKVANNPKDYCFHPDTDFTRKRKISMKAMLTGIIGMGSGSLTNELIDFFHASPQMPTPSAFLQQRSKIKPEAFRSIFDSFNETITKGFSEKMPIFAVDGSDIQIATNPGDTGSYYPGSNGQKGYDLLHLNALYEIDYHIYADSIIQKSKNCNEHKALQEMVDRSTIPEALIIADRGYESYNSMAHIQEKGWYFLIRIKDGHGSVFW